MKKKILIGLGILIVIIIGIVAYIVIDDLKQEEKLRNELERISELVDEENIDFDKVKEMLNRTVTTGDYQILEISFKSYLSDVFDTVLEIMDILSDDRLVSILTIANYQNDGPDFVETKSYITEAKLKLEELKNSYYDFFTEDKAMSYINDKELDDYYIDLYKIEFVGDIKNEGNDTLVEDSINKIIDTLNICEEVVTFLSNNSASWKIEENTIIFNTVDLSNQYLELINKIQ